MCACPTKEVSSWAAATSPTRAVRSHSVPIPARPSFAVRDLKPPKGIDDARSQDRREWKHLVDDHFAQRESDDALATMDSFYQRAYGLLSSPQARESFSLKGESDKTKTLYGMIGEGLGVYRAAGAAS